MINIKRQLEPEIIKVGASKTPVIIIDDFSDQLPLLRQLADEYAQFSPASGGYPGHRAVLPAAYGGAVYHALEGLIKRVYDISDNAQGRCFHQLFSLVTKQPDELTPLQRLPHFDTDLPHYFAIMHYLGDGDFGGTGFFKHRETGIERVSSDNKKQLTDHIRAEMQHSEPTAKYVLGSGDSFEMIEEVAYKTNRLLIYPGGLLHSGLIDPARDVSNCAATGRLTANIFIDFSR